MRSKKIIDVRLIVASVILAVIYIAFHVLGNRVYLPVENIELENVKKAVNDESGNSYIINDGGSQILRMNPSGDISLVINSGGILESGFENADAVAADKFGNIYIHNIVHHKEAISCYGRENIKVYDHNGKYICQYADIVYDSPVLKTSLIDLVSIDGVVYSISFSSHKLLVSNVLNGDIVSYDMYDAKNLVSDACYAKDQGTVYVSAKDGKIWKLFPDRDPVNIYSIDSVLKGGSYFSNISYDQKNCELYVCDIVKKEVYRFHKGNLYPVYSTEFTTYTMDATQGLIFNNVESVIRQENGRYFGYSSLVFSDGMKRLWLMVCVFYVIGLLGLLFCIVFIGYALIYKTDRRQRLIAAFSVVILLVTLGFCTIVANEMRSILVEQIKEDERRTVRFLNNNMNPDDFKSIDSVGDYNTQEYKNIKATVESILTDENGVPGNLYAVLYTLEKDGSVIQRYDFEGKYGSHYPYFWATGEEEAEIYETGEAKYYDGSDSSGDYQFIYAPLKDEKNNVIGIAEVGCDINSFNSSIDNRILMLAITVIAVSIVAILFILEIIEFKYANSAVVMKKLRSGELLPPAKLYRMLVFLVLFSISLVTPFLPIHLMQLAEAYSDMLGISAEVLSAVPISAEVVGGAVSSMGGGFLLEKLGNRKSGITGGILLIAGLVIRFIYPDLMVMTIGSFIIGTGWGILLLMVNSFIAMREDEAEVEQGFVDYTVAYQNGMNSGVVFGGFLLSFCGYNSIFMISAIIAAAPLLYVLFYIYDVAKTEAQEIEKISAKAYIKFIFSPRIIAYFFMIVVPIIAASCYINYLYPMLADRYGMQENLIGYSYLLNGLVIICFGNLIVNFMSKRFNKTLLLGIASLIYFVTFVLVGAFENIAVILLSLVLTSVSDSFGYVTQSSWYADSREVNELGYEKALGVYSLFENFSQAVGSFILGYMLTVGIGKGLIALGAVIGVLGILFIIFSAWINRLKKIRTL